jgi:hypothetical protein
MDKEPDKNIDLVDHFTKDKTDYLPQDKISNQDEIIWFLKQILINIRQRAKDNCKDCSYFKYLTEYCFEYIDQAQLESHVDFNDERFTNLAYRLKHLQCKAADEALRKTNSLKV